MLNAVALWFLARLPGRGRIAAWWWLAFLVALGPIFLGRLDGVAAALLVIALAVAVRRRPWRPRSRRSAPGSRSLPGPWSWRS
ncbi:hypothetical protein NKG05_16950 [Oerskovia sp. M15]